MRPGRNPFELWIVGACAFTGALALLPINVPRESVVDRLLPELATMWYIGIGLAGLITLLGTLLPVRNVRQANLALFLEGTGLLILGGLLAGYGLAVEFVSPRAPTGVLMIALSCASLARERQIRREFRALVQGVATATRDLDDDSSES